MNLLVLVAGVMLLLSIGFVVAPLFRSEEEVKPLYRPRPGMRTLYGPSEEDTSPSPPPSPEEGTLHCPHCGSVTDETFEYCEECLEPLDSYF